MAFPFHTVLPELSYVEIPVDASSCNLYVLGRPGESLLVDAGGAPDAEEVIATLEANDLAPGAFRAIVVTHGHLDHYGGAAEISSWSGAPVWAHPATAANIEDHRADYRRFPCAGAIGWEDFRARAGEDVRVGRLLREGDELAAGSMRLRVLHLPGHERGLVALFEPQRRLAFVGDLVQGGVDVAPTWLGLFTAPEAQRESLDRLAALEPAWLFKGHRRPRQGDEAAADIAASRRRVDDIERALLEALKSAGALSLKAALRAVFEGVPGLKDVPPLPWAAVTVGAFMESLTERGLARRTAELDWHYTG